MVQSSRRSGDRNRRNRRRGVVIIDQVNLSNEDVHEMLEEMCDSLGGIKSRIPYTYAYDVLRMKASVLFSRSEASKTMRELYPDDKERMTLIYKLASIEFLNMPISGRQIASTPELSDIVSNMEKLNTHCDGVSPVEIAANICDYLYPPKTG